MVKNTSIKTTLAALPILIFIFSTTLLSGCGSTEKTVKQSPNNHKSGVISDWELYSTGLYYKTVKKYRWSLKYFLEAAKRGVALDRVYYNIAECYYYLFEYDRAIIYADKSIVENRKYENPYLLIFNIFIRLKNYKKSSETLEDLLKERPELIHIYYMLGIHYYSRLYNYDRALAMFKGILDYKANSVEDYYKEYANYYLGYIYYRKNQIDLSIRHLEKTLEINPANNFALYILSVISMNTYNLDEAEKYISLYLSRFPGNIKLNSYMGRIHYLRQSPTTIKYLRKASSERTIDGLIAKALYLEIMHKDDLGGKYLKLILNKYPGIIAPHIGLARIAIRANDKKTALSEYFTAGILFYKVKQYDIAKRFLIKALAIDDKIPEIFFYLGKIMEEKSNISLSLIYYKRANEFSPKPDLMIHIGYLYSQKRRFNESLYYFDRAIGLEPKNPRPYFIKGIVYSRTNNYPMAERFIRMALELKANDTYYFYLATVQEKQDKLYDAIDSLKKAIKFNSKNAKAHNFLGYLYADNNMKIDESIVLIKKALMHDPHNGAYLDSLGWAYFRQGRYRMALGKLLEAEKQLDKEKSPDSVVFDHIADTYRSIGNHKKAFEYWKKSLKIKRDPKIEAKLRDYKKTMKDRK